MGRVLETSNPMGKRTGQRRAGWLVAILCLSLSAAFAETIQKKFTTVSNPSFMLHNHSGKISLKGWEQNEVEIRGERASDAVEVLIAGEEQKVTVETHPTQERLSPEEERVDFQIRVPRGATVHVDSNQGAIEVENIHGDVTIEGVSNPVALSGLRGHITVRTVEGQIHIRESEGYVRAQSISGNLELLQVNGTELIASTNSGTIRYEGDFGSGGTYVLKNYNSPIDIMTSAKASFDLTARAVEGLIENNLIFRPIPPGNPFRRLPPGKFLQGRINTGNSTVQVTSYSGTIRLQGPRAESGAIR